MADTPRDTHRLTDEQFKAIEDKHQGVRLRRVLSAAGELVIRSPTTAEESAFQQAYYGGGSQHAGLAWRNLLVMLVVHPEPIVFQAALKEWTGLAVNPRIIRELKLIRGEADEEEGK
jgi:hypothetical protein